jgi:DNA-binding transcriptional ArsR family regulator
MHAKNLSKTEIDAIKIVLAILEGHDTLNYISRYTNLSKRHVQYLLSLIKKAGLIYKKEGTKQWRVRVDYFRVWKNAEHVYYNEREIITGELEAIKELRELEKKLARRP